MNRLKKSAGIAGLAVLVVAGFEGVSTVAYYDPPRIPTICYGDTHGVRMGDTATLEECKTRLNTSLDKFSTAIDKCVPTDLPERTYVAFLSAAYNIGAPAFCSSSMARRANAGNLQGACDALLMWDKATIGGIKVALPGLTRRRTEERALCLEGVNAGVSLKWTH